MDKLMAGLVWEGSASEFRTFSSAASFFIMITH